LTFDLRNQTGAPEYYEHDQYILIVFNKKLKFVNVSINI